MNKKLLSNVIVLLAQSEIIKIRKKLMSEDNNKMIKRTNYYPILFFMTSMLFSFFVISLLMCICFGYLYDCLPFARTDEGKDNDSDFGLYFYPNHFSYIKIKF